MAIKDLGKTLRNVQKWTKDSKALQKTQTELTEKTRKKLLAAEDKLRKDSILWKGYYAHLYQLNEEFEKLAKPLIELHDDLKAAEKAGDKAKCKDLKKQIAPEEKKIATVEAKFNKNYDEMEQLVAALRKTWDAVDKVP